LDKKALSLSKLMGEASEEFVIPSTDPEESSFVAFYERNNRDAQRGLHVHQAVLIPLFYRKGMFWDFS